MDQTGRLRFLFHTILLLLYALVSYSVAMVQQHQLTQVTSDFRVPHQQSVILPRSHWDRAQYIFTNFGLGPASR